MEGNVYYAVRRGTNGRVRNCIFLRWKDCEKHVVIDSADIADLLVVDMNHPAGVMDADVEYRSFPTMELALNYLSNTATTTATMNNTTQQQQPPAMNNDAGGGASAKLPSSSSPADASGAKKNKKRKKPATNQKRKNPTTASSAATSEAASAASQALLALSPSSSSPNNKRQKRNKNPPQPQQQQAANSSSQGSSSSAATTTTTTTTTAAAAAAAAADPATTKRTRTRKPTKKWLAMLERLKQYKQRHNGSLDIPFKTEDQDEKDLRTWLQEMKKQARQLHEGKSDSSKSSSMTLEKVKLLENAGVVFQYEPSWEERMSQLQNYKRDNSGNILSIPKSHPVLGKWARSVRQQCQQGTLTQEQIDQLDKLGFQPEKSEETVAKEEDDRKWNEMFEELQNYKKENGDCLVPTTGTRTNLSSWVVKQRNAYKKLMSDDGNGKKSSSHTSSSNMTATRLQRLTEIGFAFRPRGAGGYATFEQRLEELRDYKVQHGHCRVPTSHPQLGHFVTKQRREYKAMVDGKPSAMTDERVQELKRLGFIFQAGKTPVRLVEFDQTKTWDERFDELVEFREENGHTSVPQLSGTLGMWVHTQRHQYKLWKENRPSKLTAERILRLKEIDFEFVAEKYNNSKAAANKKTTTQQ